MKNLSIVAIFLSMYMPATAQEPVTWTFSAKKLVEKKYEIRLVAKVQKGWHIYSQSTPAGGPFPATIVFNKNPLILPDGKVREEGRLQQKFEESFGVAVRYYDELVEFIQLINLRSNAKTTLIGSVEFMVCTDHECLPPAKQDFSLKLE